jgi:hypothetical protein
VFETLTGDVPDHLALNECAPSGGWIFSRAIPAVESGGTGTVAVPKVVVPSKNVTCPPLVAGTAVAVRVTFVPGAAGLAGLAANVTPDTRTEPIIAAGEPAVQTNVAPSPVVAIKETDLMPTGTRVPGLPVIGTVADSPVHLAVKMSFAFEGAVGGAVIVPPGDRFTLTSAKSPSVGVTVDREASRFTVR